MSAIWFQKTEFARLVGEGVAIDTELSICELPRVAAAALPGSGPFQVRFEFKTSQNNIVLVDGALSGQLKLRCQRCLDEMDVEIDSSLRLALLVHENQLELIPEDYEPLTIPAGEVRIVDLIEDEILLALPIAAKHTKDDCGTLNENVKSLRASTEPEKTAPFAGLAEMMRVRAD